MTLSYTHLPEAETPPPPNYAPRAPRQPLEPSVGGRPAAAAAAVVASPRMGRRQISLTPKSRSVRVRVLGTNGRVLVDMPRGVRNAEIEGRGNISAVIVGENVACNMAPYLEWISTSTHIGVNVGDGTTCTLTNLSNQQFAAVGGPTSCQYAQNQGVVCDFIDTSSFTE